MPFWEGGGVPQDSLHRSTVNTFNDNPLWKSGVNGLGLDFADGGINIPRDVLGGLSQFTVNILMDHQNQGGFSRWLFSKWTTSDLKVLLRMEFIGLRMEVILNTSGGEAPSFTTTKGLSEEGATLITLHYDGATVTVFINGVPDVTTGAATGTVDLASGAYAISEQELGGGPFAGIFYYAIANDYAWSDAQIAKLARDPFGPFRMIDEIPVIGLISVPTISNFRYRQRFFG